MKFARIFALISIFCLGLPLWADTVVLKDGTSYSGHFTSAKENTISFTGNSGIKFQFPLKDVQSLVFTGSMDTVTLRSGRTYSGHFTGGSTLNFTDNGGIQYQFPVTDVSSLVFSAASAAPPPAAISKAAEAIPSGTVISITSNEAIDSDTAAVGQTYSATINEDLRDSTGAVAIPKGSSAQLMIRDISGGGLVHSPDLVLDLASVTANGKQYNVVTSDVKEGNKKGIGANKRTAEWLGGGAAVGSLMGAIFGGGRGAAIGAAAGAGGGGLTQIVTRGHHVQVPAETKMLFHLESTLVLQPTS